MGKECNRHKAKGNEKELSTSAEADQGYLSPPQVERVDPIGKDHTIWEHLKNYAGTTEGFPSDLTRNYNHCIHKALTADHHFKQAGSFKSGGLRAGADEPADARCRLPQNKRTLERQAGGERRSRRPGFSEEHH